MEYNVWNPVNTGHFDSFVVVFLFNFPMFITIRIVSCFCTFLYHCTLYVFVLLLCVINDDDDNEFFIN